MLKLHENIPATDTHIHSRGKVPAFGDATLPSDVVIGPDDDEPIDIEALIARYNFEYMLKKVRQHRLVNLLRTFLCPSALDELLNDVAQNLHFKFWLRLKGTKRICNYEAFIARMVHNELVSEIRRCGPIRSKVKAISEHEGMLEDTRLPQPVEEVEQGVAVIQRMQEVAAIVAKLPRRQQLAMTCSLLEDDENLPLMKEILKLYGVNIEVAWPEDKKVKQRLQSNLSPARQAIAKQLHVDYTPKRRPRRSSQ